jgi:hypothetical protein
MRIGLIAGATAATGTSLQDIVEFSKTAEQRGFDNIRLANAFGFDAIGSPAGELAAFNLAPPLRLLIPVIR